MVGRLGLAIAALALFAAACGGESELEVYFEGVDDVTAAYADEVHALPIASTAGTLDDARAFFSGVHTSLGDALAGLAELTPPETAAEAHGELVDTITRFATLAGRTSERAGELQTADDLRLLAIDPVVGVGNFGAAEAELVVSCEGLEAVAEAEGIDVDLECGSLNPSGR